MNNDQIYYAVTGKMPSKPPMTTWTLSEPHYRDIHGFAFVEAYCEHGVGHHRGVHGCCGCCATWPEDIASKTTKDSDDEV